MPEIEKAARSPGDELLGRYRVDWHDDLKRICSDFSYWEDVMRYLVFLIGTLVAACWGQTETAAPADPAEANCLAAVEAVVGVGGATAISVTTLEAGTSVMVSVPGAQAPWNCVSDGAGKVQDVYYTAEG